MLTFSARLREIMTGRGGKTSITVTDKMQSGYRYVRTEPSGKNFDREFKPDLSPKQMLALGIFGGVYLRDCRKEFPADWFMRAKLSPQKNNEHLAELNYFCVNASQPLSVWRQKGWIYKDDPRGWFQWYCRYFMGRRIEKEDTRQIKRWKAMRRHIGQVQKHCRAGDENCHPKQRQALLHWAFDSRTL
jgi:hypothetical protein